jgi:hypothetical protein
VKIPLEIRKRLFDHAPSTVRSAKKRLKDFQLRTHIVKGRVTLNPNLNDVRLARVKVVAAGDEDTDVQTLAMPGSCSSCSLRMEV